MARIPRLFLENVAYHIITRGNQKQIVFPEQEDFKKYLKMLAKYVTKYQIKLYAFCLMSNHVHLAVKPNESKDMIKLMQCLNLSYTAYFNNKYNKVGHLWQARYLSKVLYNDAYIIGCITYIEANPVRANLVKHMQDYPFSSYRLRQLENQTLIQIPEL